MRRRTCNSICWHTGYGRSRHDAGCKPRITADREALQGVSFDIGMKRAVSYFLSDEDSCKLTLMLAEIVHGDEVNGLTATRVTVAIEAGKAAHTSLEFKCQAGAHVMSIVASNQVTHPE